MSRRRQEARNAFLREQKLREIDVQQAQLALTQSVRHYLGDKTDTAERAVVRQLAHLDEVAADYDSWIQEAVSRLCAEEDRQ